MLYIQVTRITVSLIKWLHCFLHGQKRTHDLGLHTHTKETKKNGNRLLSGTERNRQNNLCTQVELQINPKERGKRKINEMKAAKREGDGSCGEKIDSKRLDDVRFVSTSICSSLKILAVKRFSGRAPGSSLLPAEFLGAPVWHQSSSGRRSGGNRWWCFQPGRLLVPVIRGSAG